METKRIGKEARCLFALILLYAATRLPVILSNTETISLNLYRGTVAKEFLLGFNLPWWNYLTDPYALAPVFNGILTAPFFLLFGESLFALKLVPFVWHLFSLIIWYFVWRSCFSQRQAFFISLLFIFTSPWIIQFTTSNHGTHCEMILWIGLSLLVFRRVVEGRVGAVWGGLFLGLLGGFASALILTYLVTTAIVFLYSFLCRQKWRFYFLYAVGFLVGFSPMLYYNAFHTSWKGVAKVSEFYFWGFDGQAILDNFSRVFMNWETGLGGLFGFWDLQAPWGLALGVTYLFLYLFSLLFLIYRRWGFWKNLSGRWDAEAFGLMYQLFHIFLMVMATAGWGLQYAMPMVPFIGMTIVSSASALPLLWRRSLLSFGILAGIVGNFLAIDWKRMGETRHLQGFSYGEMGETIGYMFGYDLDLFQQKIGKIMEGKSADGVELFYKNLHDEVVGLNAREDIPKRLTFIRHLPEALHPVFYQKLGIHLSILLQSDSGGVEEILQEYGISKNFYPDIYYGFVLGLNRTDLNGEGLVKKGLAICEKVPALSKSGCYEGVGALVDPDYWQGKVAHHIAVVLKIPKDYHPDYFHGLGRYWTSIWVEQPKSIEDFLRSLNAGERGWFFEGMREELAFVEDPWRKSEWLKKLKSLSEVF